MVMKIVPVGAVDLSIGPFCTEFRCERFRDDAVFRNIENLTGWDRFGSAGSAVRAGSVRAGSAVCVGSVLGGFLLYYFKSWIGLNRDPGKIRNKFGKSTQNGPRKLRKT